MHNDILEKIRSSAGLTQAGIANKVEISIRAYQNYEAGKRIPNAHVAQRIAKVLNRSVEDLFNYIDNSNTQEMRYTS